MTYQRLLIAWIASGAGCAADTDPDVRARELGSVIENEPCDYITCGGNSSAVGNRFVDQVLFDHTPNERGQSFLDWTIDGATITPALDARVPVIATGGTPTAPPVGFVLKGRIDGELAWGPALDGSVMRLIDRRGQITVLHVTNGRAVSLPNQTRTWVYWIDVWPAQQPLCDLFADTDDELARYALLGAREVVHRDERLVTEHAAAEGKLTLGCPTTATGKLLSLGALRTTAASGQQPTVDEMTAALRALTMSPTGDRSYTEPGRRIMFYVPRTRVKNYDELETAGREGYWNAAGAVCFEHLRFTDPALGRQLWNDTHVPPCSALAPADRTGLVETWLPPGLAPDYPPGPAEALP